MHITLPPRPCSRVHAALIELAWPLAFLLINLAFLFPFFLIKTSHVLPNDKPRCLANGQPIFPWNQTVNEYWTPSTALFITLGHGQYTYPEAKAIDVIWDLLVGRGGQILAAIWSYYAVRKSMLFTMEQQDVAIPIAYSVYFDKLGLGLLGSIIRNLLHGRSHNAKAIPIYRLLGWLSLCVYVTSFPTILAAMTGYQSRGSVYFQQNTGSGSSLSAAEYIQPNFPLVIRDGSRVGLWDNVELPAPYIADYVGLNVTGNATYNLVLSYYFALTNALTNTTYQVSASQWTGSNSQLIGPYIKTDNGSVPAYSYCTISQSGGDTCAYMNGGSFKTGPDAPQSPTAAYTWSNITLHNETYVLQPPPLDVVATGPANSWSVSLDLESTVGTYYSNRSVAHGAVCLPDAKYQWGFSAVLLLLFCIFTTLFGAVLLALQLEVYHYSRANRIAGGIDGYRDAVHIVHALKENLGDEVVNDDAQGLRQKLKCYSGALSIETSNLPAARRRRRRLNGGRVEERKGIPLLEREGSMATGTTYETVKHDDDRDSVVR